MATELVLREEGREPAGVWEKMPAIIWVAAAEQAEAMVAGEVGRPALATEEEENE